MSSKRNQNFSENENTCVVCFKNVDIYSIGDCDHPVCFECSTRMRVLCLQNECPICRRDMPKVIFTTDVQTFILLKTKALTVNLLDKKFGIYFMTSDLERAYLQLLIHKCSKCDNEIFQTFQQLKDHMRRQHEVFYCDLCSENLKIFSFERRCYTRSQLALHRRKGDPDDKSHKGHPLCEFCDTRYMDSDELYRHLRRDHLYCHFCDADGKHHYYSSYDFLRQHFQNEHFLCEEGDCKTEQFTSVFRTDIDLKVHKASAHGRQLGKIGAKQARTLELEFRLAPRPRPGDPQNQQQPRQPRIPPPQTLGQHLGMGGGVDDWLDDDGAVGGLDLTTTTETGTIQNPIQKKLINALDPNLFPSLGGAPAPSLSTIAAKPLTRSSGGGSGITIRHTRQGLAKNDENFPALSTEVPSGSTLRFSVNSASSSSNGPTITKTPNVSIHVNHRPGIVSVTGPTTTRVNKLNEHMSSKETYSIESKSEAFPVLGSSTNTIQPAQWITPKSKEKSKPNKVPSVPVLPINKISNNLKNFPSLSKAVVVNGGGVPTQKQNKIETPVKKVLPNSCSSEESSIKSTESKTKNKKKKTKTVDTTVTSIPPTTAKDFLKKSPKNNTSGAFENENNSKSESKKKNKTVEVKKEVDTKKTTNQNGKVERKRSELNIGNLKTPNLQEHADFPALGSTSSSSSSSSSIKKPPGFDSWPVKGPPPGFKQPPPPGFNTVQLDMVAQSANDLTFTNSSGQKYSILPNKSPKNCVFYLPPNFNQRNKKLVQSFMTALSDDDLNEFRQLSHLFKEGSYTAKNYYDYCKKCLGLQFENIFPELLALLPDIEKQTELYNIYMKGTKDKKSMNNNNNNSIVQLELCAVCGQVCVSNDLRHHVANHTLENHFPVLGGGSVGEISTAWKK